MLIDVGTNRAGLVATIAAGRGGRTVSLRFPGGENLIDPGATDWNAESGSGAGLEAEWSQDFGQVVWLGPQSRFWADQTAIPGRPVEMEGWPPDPISVNGSYEVRDQSAGRPILEIEHHAPWVRLEPGRTMSHEEVWRWKANSGPV